MSDWTSFTVETIGELTIKKEGFPNTYVFSIYYKEACVMCLPTLEIARNWAFEHDKTDVIDLIKFRRALNVDDK